MPQAECVEKAVEVPCVMEVCAQEVEEKQDLQPVDDGAVIEEDGVVHEVHVDRIVDAVPMADKLTVDKIVEVLQAEYVEQTIQRESAVS